VRLIDKACGARPGDHGPREEDIPGLIATSPTR